MNRDLAIRLFKATSPSSAWWGPARGYVSLSSVMADPVAHGLEELTVSHLSSSFDFCAPEWCATGAHRAFCCSPAAPGPDQVASFEGCRLIGLDGLLVTRADRLLRESVLEPGDNHDAHPAMRSPWYGRVRRIRQRVAVIASRFSNNYYHWLFDILPRFEMIRMTGVPVDTYYIHVPGDFQRESLELLGVPRDLLFPAQPRIQITADRIILPLVPGGLEHVPAWAVRYLRDRLARGASGNPRRLIYISRAKCRYRKVTNEMEVVALLKGRGFETVYLEDMSFREQVDLLASARAVVAAHGAGLANIVFCEPGTPIVECFRGDYVNALYYRIARLCDHPYAAVIAPGEDAGFVGMDQSKLGTSFAIPIDQLTEALTAMGV